MCDEEVWEDRQLCLEGQEGWVGMLLNKTTSAPSSLPRSKPVLRPLYLYRGGGGEQGCFRGVFGTAPHIVNHYVVYPGNTPCKPPPYRSAHDPFRTALGVRNSGPWDPGLPGAGEKAGFSHSALSGLPPIFGFRCCPRHLSECVTLLREVVLCRS